jgi:hypothetical protein
MKKIRKSLRYAEQLMTPLKTDEATLILGEVNFLWGQYEISILTENERKESSK